MEPPFKVACGRGDKAIEDSVGKGRITDSGVAGVDRRWLVTMVAVRPYRSPRISSFLHAVKRGGVCCGHWHKEL